MQLTEKQLVDVIDSAIKRFKGDTRDFRMPLVT